MTAVTTTVSVRSGARRRAGALSKVQLPLSSLRGKRLVIGKVAKEVAWERAHAQSVAELTVSERAGNDGEPAGLSASGTTIGVVACSSRRGERSSDMPGAPGIDTRGALSALLRSYAADLRGWAMRLAAGYGVALALLAGGVLALFAAIAVGITAIFHFLERLYGLEVAYGSIGGGLLALAITLFLAGWLMLRRKATPLPQPRRQLHAAKQILVEPAARRVVGVRPVTRVLVGAAATLLVGSILGSRFQTSRRARSGSR